MISFRSNSAFRSRGRVLVALATVLGLAACDGGADLDLARPDPRPSDGVMADAALQEVVAYQIEGAWAPLAARLAHERPEVRARSALALASVQAYEAVPDLVALMHDPEASVRRDVAFALGQSAQRDAAAPLLEALASEQDAEVRHRILEALGKIAYDEVLEALLALEVDGRDEADRLLAIGRLGAIRGMVTPASINALLAGLDHRDADVRAAAAFFFGRPIDPSTWGPRASRVRQTLDGYAAGDPAAIPLIKGLGRLQEPADVERLATLAGSSPDWRIRAEAMAALGGRAVDDATRDVMLAGLDDASIHVAGNAANALSDLTLLPSTLGRISAWVDANPDRWQVAAPLLGALARQDQHEFVLGWMDALGPDDEARRAAGVRALGQLKGEEARERLRAALSGESEAVASAAVISLRQRWAQDQTDSRLHEAYFAIFAEALRTGRRQALTVASAVLVAPGFQAMGSTALLLEELAGAAPEDAVTRRILLGALGRTGDPAVEGALREALEDPLQEVREAAAAALAQLTGTEVEAPAGGEDPPQDSAVPLTWDPQVIDWAYLSGLGTAPRLVLETDRGVIVVQLSPEEAPQTVQSLARLAQDGRFDGTPFHRVVADFVVQGGDVGNRDGTGGPGFSIRTEITGIPFQRGVIGMASAGKDTEGSQFFITHSAQPHLDGQYTAFGWLVEGADVLDSIAQGDLLRSARIE